MREIIAYPTAVARVPGAAPGDGPDLILLLGAEGAGAPAQPHQLTGYQQAYGFGRTASIQTCAEERSGR